MASPAEDVAFDASSHVVPRLERDAPGLDGLDTSLDLSVPSRCGIRLRGTVQACQEFSGELGTGVVIEPESLGQHRAGRLRHRSILRLGAPANNRLLPAALGAMMKRRG
jgi:hypothetical protein